jgi:hypothetical protein
MRQRGGNPEATRAIETITVFYRGDIDQKKMLGFRQCGEGLFPFWQPVSPPGSTAYDWKMNSPPTRTKRG